MHNDYEKVFARIGINQGFTGAADQWWAQDKSRQEPLQARNFLILLAIIFFAINNAACGEMNTSPSSKNKHAVELHPGQGATSPADANSIAQLLQPPTPEVTEPFQIREEGYPAQLIAHADNLKAGGDRNIQWATATGNPLINVLRYNCTTCTYKDYPSTLEQSELRFDLDGYHPESPAYAIIQTPSGQPIHVKGDLRSMFALGTYSPGNPMSAELHQLFNDPNSAVTLIVGSRDNFNSPPFVDIPIDYDLSSKVDAGNNRAGQLTVTRYDGAMENNRIFRGTNAHPTSGWEISTTQSSIPAWKKGFRHKHPARANEVYA